MNKLKLTFLFILNLLFVNFATSAADDGINLDMSRIIFNQDDKSQSIVLHNGSNKLFLAESVMTLDLNGSKSQNFMTIPPLVRIEANSDNMFKIILKDLDLLPTDRETMQYFTVSLIPSSKKDAAENNVIMTHVAVVPRFIIKFFYRPKHIKYDIESATKNISYLVREGVLYAVNHSAMNVTLVNLRFDGEKYQSSIAPIVPPFSQLAIIPNAKINTISWSGINDYGGYTEEYQFNINNIKNKVAD